MFDAFLDNPFMDEPALHIFWQSVPMMMHATYYMLCDLAVGMQDNTARAIRYFLAIIHISSNSLEDLLAPIPSPLAYLNCQPSDTHP
jgi:hypothetical protein